MTFGTKEGPAQYETPRNDDRPGFVTEDPEHCFACFRLMHPSQARYLTIEHEVLGADCALVEGVISRET